MFSNRTETCPRFVSEMNCCASQEDNTSLVRVGRLMSFVARACKTAEEWEASIQRLRAPANGSHALAQEEQQGSMKESKGDGSSSCAV